MSSKLNGAVKIEKNVPMPENRGVKPRYPWKEMEVGDSFVSTSPNISKQAVVAGRTYGRKFATRKVEGGFRVWRIA